MRSFSKPKFLSVDAVSFRSNILNNYLARFPSLDIKSFLEDKMINIVPSMLPVVWINNTITASLYPREKVHEGLIDHRENFESSLPDEPIPKEAKSTDALDTISILKKEE